MCMIRDFRGSLDYRPLTTADPVRFFLNYCSGIYYAVNFLKKTFDAHSILDLAV